jgi:hypothetical protein
MKSDANDILREQGPDALRHAFDHSVRAQNKKNSKPNGQMGLVHRDRTTLEDFYAYMPMHATFMYLRANCGRPLMSTRAFHQSQFSIARVNSSSTRIISPKKQRQACGWTGIGRLSR